MGRRAYAPPEFRRKVLDPIDSGRKVADVAHNLGIIEHSIYTVRHGSNLGEEAGPRVAVSDNESVIAWRTQRATWQKEDGGMVNQANSRGRQVAQVYIGAAAPLLLMGVAPVATSRLLQSVRGSLLLANPDYIALTMLAVVGVAFGLAVASVPIIASRAWPDRSARSALPAILAGASVGMLFGWAIWRFWPTAIVNSLDVAATMWTTSLGAYLATGILAAARRVSRDRTL